ncbi:VOC family protein [Portibacter lacus]|uniref:Glyoxalase n=1 Tax=Portibacter lacus TaxID=1099794 RepID=A0AA37WDQ7_9BACT|nr:VOC family protein [Portibacter lacus]GLR17248.1 glyoxalase [Portibacter lacus]
MKKGDLLGLRTTIYKVGNLNRAKEWYASAFQVAPYFDEPFYVGFNIGGFELGLQPEEKPSQEKADHVVSYWGVDDIHKVYDHFIQQGAISHEKPYNVGGELMTATVFDPFGNCIGLIFNPYFKLKGE